MHTAMLSIFGVWKMGIDEWLMPTGSSTIEFLISELIQQVKIESQLKFVCVGCSQN